MFEMQCTLIKKTMKTIMTTPMMMMTKKKNKNKTKIVNKQAMIQRNFKTKIKREKNQKTLLIPQNQV